MILVGFLVLIDNIYENTDIISVIDNLFVTFPILFLHFGVSRMRKLEGQWLLPEREGKRVRRSVCAYEEMC